MISFLLTFFLVASFFVHVKIPKVKSTYSHKDGGIPNLEDVQLLCPLKSPIAQCNSLGKTGPLPANLDFGLVLTRLTI